MSESETKINHLISEYFKGMKEAITKKISASAINGEVSDKDQELLRMIHEYPILTLSEKDYTKRKRVKTNVPLYEKCLAKRANGEQCSRRKKQGSDFCGTHVKGCPNGVISKPTEDGETVSAMNDSQSGGGMVKKQIQVQLEDINGIYYWISDNGMVYDTGDVMNNVENPRVIAKYEKIMEGGSEVYKIIGEVH